MRGAHRTEHLILGCRPKHSDSIHRTDVRDRHLSRIGSSWLDRALRRVHATLEMAKELRRMRFSKLLLTTAAAGLTAFAAVAQQPDPSDDQPPAETKAEPSRGLSDLEETVNQLLEEEDQPISRQSDEPRVPDQLPPEPEASRPPPEPALEPRASEPTPGEPPVEASAPAPRRRPGPRPTTVYVTPAKAGVQTSHRDPSRLRLDASRRRHSALPPAPP